LKTDKPSPGFTTDDLLTALQAMLPEAGSGVPLMRTAEIAEALGCSVTAARQYLHILDVQGRLVKGKVTLPTDETLGFGSATVPAFGLKLPDDDSEEET